MHMVKEWAKECNTPLYYDAWQWAQKDLNIEIWITNTVLGASIYTVGEPVKMHQGEQQFHYYELAWIDGSWHKDIYINVAHIVMRHRLTAE